jgi:hypothetical protein
MNVEVIVVIEVDLAIDTEKMIDSVQTTDEDIAQDQDLDREVIDVVVQEHTLEMANIAINRIKND